MTREQVDAIISSGGVNPNRDTVYRVGSADPTGFFTQSQLNNAMSGNDANAIYQATHRQNANWTYNDRNPNHVNPWGENPQDYNDRLRQEGYLPNTGRQLSMPVYGDGAYVAGADAWSNPIYDELLPAGAGSPQGIPNELLSPSDQTYADVIRAMLASMGSKINY